MRITAIAFPVLRLQYRIARAPLELFDKHFVSRMNSKAPGPIAVSAFCWNVGHHCR